MRPSTMRDGINVDQGSVGVMRDGEAVETADGWEKVSSTRSG